MEVTDGVSLDDLVAGDAAFYGGNRCSLTEPVPWGDLVLLAQIGSEATGQKYECRRRWLCSISH